jgi:hypothetical protein
VSGGKIKGERTATYEVGVCRGGGLMVSWLPGAYPATQTYRSSLLIPRPDSSFWLKEGGPPFRGDDLALLLIAEDKGVFLPIKDEGHG